MICQALNGSNHAEPTSQSSQSRVLKDLTIISQSLSQLVFAHGTLVTCNTMAKSGWTGDLVRMANWLDCFQIKLVVCDTMAEPAGLCSKRFGCVRHSGRAG